MTKRNKLERKQFAAILASVKLGIHLQDDLPQIADDYRRGLFASEIVSKYDIVRKYGVNKTISENAVYYALRGNSSFLDYRIQYHGLLEEDEMRQLADNNRIRHGLELGSLCLEQRVGLFGRTQEEHSRDSKKAGRKIVEQRLGIHRLSTEERRLNGALGGRRGGVQTSINRGYILWTEEEIELAYILSQDKDYKFQKGLCKGKSDLKKMAERLNQEYHQGNSIRNSETIKSKLRKFKKRINGSGQKV